MDHPTIHQLLAHLDDVLDPERAEAIASHLRGCAACARELELHRRIQRSARSAFAERMHPAFVEDILVAAMPVQPKLRRAPRFELSAGNILFGVFLSVTTMFAVFVFLQSAPREQADSGTTRFQETVTILDQGLTTAMQHVKQLVKPLRVRSSEAATSTIVLLLPVLILLFLLDWYLSRFLGNRNRVE